MADKKYNQLGESMSFGDALLKMSQKGGIIEKKISLTKKRANALRFLLAEAIYNIPDCEHSGTSTECECNNHFYEAIEWVTQQINKKYSIFDLCNEKETDL